MDLGIIFGFLGTWVLIAWALLVSGDVTMFVDAPSIILVVGASAMVIIYATPMRYLKQIVAIVKKAYFFQSDPIEKLIEDMVHYAEVARRDGILSLENTTKDIKDEFIVQGIQMAVDGTDPELIEQIMTNELDNLVERHDAGKSIFEMIGKYAPAFGMIGTLVGLVIMLQNMNDPAKIGPGMAVGPADDTLRSHDCQRCGPAPVRSAGTAVRRGGHGQDDHHQGRHGDPERRQSPDRRAETQNVPATFRTEERGDHGSGRVTPLLGFLPRFTGPGPLTADACDGDQVQMP